MEKLGFGKYKDLTISEAWEQDQQYCKWLSNQEMLMDGRSEMKKFLTDKMKDTDMSYVMSWGKHKGRSIAYIKKTEYGYIEWLLKNRYVSTNCKTLHKELLELVASSTLRVEE